jgi:DNA-binding transcriptional regulator YiaG
VARLWRWEGVDPRRLLAWRRSRGLSRRAFAKALGVSEASVFEWERHGHAPRPEVQERVARLLAGRAAALPTPTRRVTPAAIRAFRARHSWSRRRLALAIGVSEATIHGWETGAHLPLPLLQARLSALVYGVGPPQ